LKTDTITFKEVYEYLTNIQITYPPTFPLVAHYWEVLFNKDGKVLPHLVILVLTYDNSLLVLSEYESKFPTLMSDMTVKLKGILLMKDDKATNYVKFSEKKQKLMFYGSSDYIVEFANVDDKNSFVEMHEHCSKIA